MTSYLICKLEFPLRELHKVKDTIHLQRFHSDQHLTDSQE